AAADARFRLFDAVSAVLREAAARAPLLIVLDDLHMADPSSLALLHFVARNLRGIGALFLCTYRDEEARLRPEVGQLLADVAREGTYLPLAPLSDADVAALVGVLGGEATVVDQALIEEIHRTTEGNPLFLEQLLRLLHQRGDLAGAKSGRLPVPETVRDAIRRRVARLGTETVEVLATASVFGREWGWGALLALGERLGGGFAGAGIDAAIEAAERAALLMPLGEGRWRFSHVLVGETLYRDLALHRRAELHLEIAGLLGEGGPEALAEIAHHRLAALPAGDAVAAAESARRAADHAANLLAFEDAALLLEQAHAALRAARVGDARLACELSLAAGFARMRGGDLERGRALCEGAAQEARRLGDGELFARCALGYGAELIIGRTDETLRRLLTEALDGLPAEPSGLRAQVMARLAAALQPAVNPLEPVAAAREAVAMARAVGAPPEVLRGVLYFAGSAMAEYADPSERASVSEELVELARAAHDRPQLLRAHARLVFDHLEMGQVDRARESINQYEGLARTIGQARHIWPARLMRAMMAAAIGDFAEAARLGAEARGLAASDADPMTAVSLALYRLAEVMQCERPAEVPDLLVEMEAVLMSPFPSIGRDVYHSARAAVLARLTDDRDEIARSLETIGHGSAYVRHEYPAMACLAEPVYAVGHRKFAEVIYEHLLPTAHRLVNFGRVGFFCWGPMETAVAIYAFVLGRPDEARVRLERAAVVAEQKHLRPALAHIRAWQARFALAPGGPGAVAAEPFLQQAEDLAATLPLPVLADRLRALRAGAGHERASLPQPRPPAAGKAAVVAGTITMVREGEYWTISAGAATTRQKDTRGLQMLAELLANPGREFHALLLMGAEAGADEGDAGELLDAEAIATYRARVEALDDELAEAESWGDGTRASRARAERDAIADELSRGVGLGGRVRRGGSAAERARVNVQRRIRGAIRKIGVDLPDVGAYLDRAVRTGAFCCDEPH
ncbi:MAG TPA: hypothetical protein VGF45_22030, partial [Polyangia bacterium]